MVEEMDNHFIRPILRIIVRSKGSVATCQEIKNSFETEQTELERAGRTERVIVPENEEIMQVLNRLIQREGEFKFDIVEREGKFEFAIKTTKKFWQPHIS